MREPDLCPGATGKCNGTFVNDKVHASKKPIITTIIKGSLGIFVKTDVDRLEVQQSGDLHQFLIRSTLPLAKVRPIM